MTSLMNLTTLIQVCSMDYTPELFGKTFCRSGQCARYSVYGNRDVKKL